MSRTYKATGINLKSMPIGEADRLLTILTREHGLLRATAMGARKHNSSLAGRSGLFVVNQLLIVKGRSLDKVTQAETLESYPGLSQDLSKLTASQYLAELCLCQALSEQPQEELFFLLNLHLGRLEQLASDRVLPHLIHAIFELLVLAGVAPEVNCCGMTRQALVPDFDDANWRAGFSAPVGGVVTLAAVQQLQSGSPTRSASGHQAPIATRNRSANNRPQQRQLHRTITAMELAILQAVAAAAMRSETTAATAELPPLHGGAEVFIRDWLAIEHLLRQYAEYHFDRTIRSAALVDACFLTSLSAEM